MLRSPWVGVSLRASLVAGITLIGFYLLKFTLPLIYPFIVGGIIALMIEPIVQWLEHRVHMPRWAGVTLVLLLLLTLILSLFIFLVSEIVVELVRLANFLPHVFDQIGKVMLDAFTKDNTSLSRIIDTVQGYLTKYPDNQQHISQTIQQNIGLITGKGTSLITQTLSGIGAFLGNLPYMFTVLVFITLAAFFIALDLPKLQGHFIRLVPVRVKQTGSLVFVDLKQALFGFLRAQLILITITALIMLIGLLILDVDYAFLVAVLVGLADLLPYIGVGGVLIPWIIYLMLTGDAHLGIGVAIVYGVIIIVRNVLEPRLVASSVGLDPLPTLIAIFVGLQLFGVPGLLIGPVIIVVLFALYRAQVFHDIWHYVRGEKV